MQSLATKPTRRSQEERVRETRRALIDAVVESLDRHGFAATTISTVQEIAGVSRGALMHHYASKQDMIVAVARTLLDQAIRPARRVGSRRAMASGNLVDLLLFYWRQVMNTREGRAFIEILVACRTDADLNAVLRDHFAAWDADIARTAQENFTTVSGSAEDAAELWAITRAFLRGLVIHARFTRDPAQLEEMVRRFGMMLSAEMSIRGTAQ